MENNNTQTTALIDADSLIYIACYCKPDEPKTLDDCKFIISKLIQDIVDNTRASNYLLFLTVGRGFRYKVYPAYKANRKGEKPVHFNEVKQFLIDKYGAIHHPELEADDLCLISNKVIPNSFICAVDKDILKLEGKHYNYKSNNWVDTSKHEALVHFFTSLITGDSVDNIKGIPGKGEKFAEKLFSVGKMWTDEEANYDNNVQFYRNTVFQAYLDHYGEYEGIHHFAVNYKCLKILDTWSESLDFLKYYTNDDKEGNN